MASIGAPALLVALPWLLAMSCQAVGYGQILGVLHRSASFPRLLSVLVSAEAVLMSFPAGQAIAESLNPLPARASLRRALAGGAGGRRRQEGAHRLHQRALHGRRAGRGWGVAATSLAGAPRRAGLPLAGRGRRRRAPRRGVGLGPRALLGVGRVAVARRAPPHPQRPLAPLARRAAAGFTATDRQFVALSKAGAGTLVAATAAFLGCWLVEGAEALVILRLLRVDVSYGEVLAFEVVVSLLRNLAFMVPAGIGVQDASYVAFFGAFGVPDAPTLGVAFVLIKRAKELLWIAVGLLLFVVLRDVPSQQDVEEEEAAPTG